MTKELQMKEYGQATKQYYLGDRAIYTFVPLIGPLVRALEYTGYRKAYREERKKEKSSLEKTVRTIQKKYGLGASQSKSKKAKPIKQRTSSQPTIGYDGANLVDDSYIAYNPLIHNKPLFVTPQLRKKEDIEITSTISNAYTAEDISTLSSSAQNSSSQSSTAENTSPDFQNSSYDASSSHTEESYSCNDNGTSTVVTSHDGTLEEKVSRVDDTPVDTVQQKVIPYDEARESLEDFLGSHYYDIQKNGTLVRVGRDNNNAFYILLRKGEGEDTQEVVLRDLDERKLRYVTLCAKEGRLNMLEVYDFLQKDAHTDVPSDRLQMRRFYSDDEDDNSDDPLMNVIYIKGIGNPVTLLYDSISRQRGNNFADTLFGNSLDVMIEQAKSYDFIIDEERIDFVFPKWGYNDLIEQVYTQSDLTALSEVNALFFDHVKTTYDSYADRMKKVK